MPIWIFTSYILYFSFLAASPITTCSWYPGNLREMHNIISTLYVFYEDGVVDDLKRLPRLEDTYQDSNSLNYEEAEAPFMRSHIRKVLQYTHGNITRAADLIGWARLKFFVNDLFDLVFQFRQIMYDRIPNFV